MKYINFNTLKISNFLSIGKKPIEIEFQTGLNIITGVNKRFDKKNRQWAIIDLDGILGNAEILVFSETFEKYKSLLLEDNSIFIIGSPLKREESTS